MSPEVRRLEFDTQPLCSEVISERDDEGGEDSDLPGDWDLDLIVTVVATVRGSARLDSTEIRAGSTEL